MYNNLVEPLNKLLKTINKIIETPSFRSCSMFFLMKPAISINCYCMFDRNGSRKQSPGVPVQDSVR